jgi:cytochrome c peroxidase
VDPPPVPAEWPLTPARVELGRHLFYDTRLSGNGTQSCASCHRQELAFTDGLAGSVGSTGMVHPRSAMTLVNTAYRDALTWANPSLRSLEAQVLVPMLGTVPIELGLEGHEPRVYGALGRDAVYRPLFAEAFPGETDPVTRGNVAAALAAFVRSIVSFRAPLDRYRQHEESDALPPQAVRGSTIFFSDRKGRCGNCHRGLNLDGGSRTAAGAAARAEDDPVFGFHNTGLYNLPGLLSYPVPNTGLHARTGRPDDVGKFRVPTLRNIAVTAPYMHDGSIATLDEVLDHYVAGGRAPNPTRSTGIAPLSLTAQERADLLAFLESLTDEEALRDPRWMDPNRVPDPGRLP